MLPRILTYVSLFLSTVCASSCGRRWEMLTVPPPEEGVELPVNSDEVLIISGKINGKAAEIFIDTGSPTNGARPEAIAKYNLVPAGENPLGGVYDQGIGICEPTDPTIIDDVLYMARRLQFGDMVFEQVPVTIANLGEGSAPGLEDVDFLV